MADYRADDRSSSPAGDRDWLRRVRKALQSVLQAEATFREELSADSFLVLRERAERARRVLRAMDAL